MLTGEVGVYMYGGLERRSQASEHAANSMVTLALLSPKFFDSEYCRAEVEAAAASKFCKSVIPVYSGQYYTAPQTTALLKDKAPEKQAAIKAVHACPDG